MTEEVLERLWTAVDNNDLETLLQILSEDLNDEESVRVRRVDSGNASHRA